VQHTCTCTPTELQITACIEEQRCGIPDTGTLALQIYPQMI